MLHNPISFINLNLAKTVHKHTAISANQTDPQTPEEDESAMDELEEVTNRLIREVGQNGIESKQPCKDVIFLIFSFVKIFSVDRWVCDSDCVNSSYTGNTTGDHCYCKQC